MMVEIKFKKIHPNAKLPSRNHGNRAINDYERNWLEEENKRFEQEKPEHFAAGYRVGFPFEEDGNGGIGDLIQGTGDTGYDIFAVEDQIIPADGNAIVQTGIEVAYISPGYWFKIEARSGLGFKYSIMPHPGIIDNCYRGGLGTKLYNLSSTDYKVSAGDRIAQMVLYPIVNPLITWSEEKIETPRNEGGFGSSGN